MIRKSFTRHEKHGDWKKDSPYKNLYRAWSAMKNRCSDTNNKNYGGRGITVCDEWKNSYLAFKEWSLANGWAPGLEIDRINNETGHYEPSNCRWATKHQNSWNRRTNDINSLRIKEEIRSLYTTGGYSQRKLAKMYEIDQTTVWRIINRYTGESTKRLPFTEEEIMQIREMSSSGENQYQIAKNFGVSHATINNILNKKNAYKEDK